MTAQMEGGHFSVLLGAATLRKPYAVCIRQQLDFPVLISSLIFIEPVGL